MYTSVEERNKVIAEFMGDSMIELSIPFQYELNEELPTSNNICTKENVEDEVRLEIEEGVINSVEVMIELVDYHTSWNKLIPVMSKIYRKGVNLNNLKAFRLAKIIESFNQWVIEDNIEFAQKAVFDAIQLLNEK